ncbi:MAG: integral rane sensor signal transduction histidine kinase [Gammaproteobacteria bacterium]|nr:integral rane sensor signal transduction histidine kinase [Gammaproteobacteria bacterium]
MARNTEYAATLGLPAGGVRETEPGVAIFDDSTGLENMRQLIQLRWIAVMGQIVTIAVVHFGFDIRLPLHDMSVVLLCLMAFNVASLLLWRGHHEVTNGVLFFALLVDVTTLTAQLYLSGGATNPFGFLYLLQVILGAVLLRAWSVWTMVAITSACFTGLTLFYRPLALPPDGYGGLPAPYIQGTLICFALNAALLVIFIARINRNLRARDARLADLRQRAVEEEHIVRMGLLASGAAHELGTPLSTLSVILGDWRRMPTFTADSELLQEIDEMQVQVKRCKSIVSGILLSAGEARGESPVATTLRTFLNDLVAEWRATRPVIKLTYESRFGADLPIVSDSALKQMICNVLDNALEASPDWVGFDATRDGDVLRLTVTDSGPGFAPEMLAQLGKPYQSSKWTPGAGLGLFLVANVARTLRGNVTARNRAEGGAIVTLTLPLAAITLEEGMTYGS